MIRKAATLDDRTAAKARGAAVAIYGRFRETGQKLLTKAASGSLTVGDCLNLVRLCASFRNRFDTVAVKAKFRSEFRKREPEASAVITDAFRSLRLIAKIGQAVMADPDYRIEEGGALTDGVDRARALKQEHADALLSAIVTELEEV